MRCWSLVNVWATAGWTQLFQVFHFHILWKQSDRRRDQICQTVRLFGANLEFASDTWRLFDYGHFTTKTFIHLGKFEPI